MNTHRFRALSLLLLLLSLALLFCACDDATDSNNKQPLIAIKTVDFDGTEIRVVYEDGYEIALKLEDVALSHKLAFAVSTKPDGDGQEPDDTSEKDSFGASYDDGKADQTLQVETFEKNYDGDKAEPQTKEPDKKDDGQVEWITADPDKNNSKEEHFIQSDSAFASSRNAVFVLGAPQYTWKDGTLCETNPESNLMFSTVILVGDKQYEGYYAKITDYVRENLTSVKVPSSFSQSTTMAPVDTPIFSGGVSNGNFSYSFNVGNLEDYTGKDVVYEGAFSTNITITTTVTDIRSGAFARLSKLESITLPSTIQRIGVGAFCDSPALTEIVFEGTLEQWNAIEKDTGWSFGAAAFTVRCSDGTVAPEVIETAQ